MTTPFFSKNNKKLTVVTHSGNFHPDEVFAIATLCLYFTTMSRKAQRNNNQAGKDAFENSDKEALQDFVLVRTRDEAMVAAGDYVVDIGMEYDPGRRRFDHHQKGGAGLRSNGIPYASFGLVWKEYGLEICDDGSIEYDPREVASIVDKKLVQPTDANDNGVALDKPILEDVQSYTIADAISSFVPTWDESLGHNDLVYDERFRQALEFALLLLKREIKRSKSRARGNAKVLAAYESAADKRIILLDQQYSWGDVLRNFPEPIFVINPDKMNTVWHVKAISEKHSFKNRKDLPVDWAGKRDAELAAVTGVHDAVFCHNARFLVVAKTRESALRLAELAVNAETNADMNPDMNATMSVAMKKSAKSAKLEKSAKSVKLSK
jgi:uncharacterized UPF0160 family protein